MTAVSQTELSRPRPKTVPRASRRDLIVWVVAVTVGGFLVGQLLVLWDFHRRAPISAALLQPLIDYHAIKSDDQLDRIGTDRRLAGELLIGGMKEFCSAAQFAYLAFTRNQKPDEITVLTDWQQARNFFLSCGQSFGWARERLWDAEWHERMSKYHVHAGGYYSVLLVAGATSLPPLPSYLAAERRAAEEEFLRFRGIKYTLPPEPPPHLLPGYVPAKRSKPLVAPFTNAPADSY